MKSVRDIAQPKRDLWIRWAATKGVYAGQTLHGQSLGICKDGSVLVRLQPGDKLTHFDHANGDRLLYCGSSAYHVTRHVPSPKDTPAPKPSRLRKMTGAVATAVRNKVRQTRKRLRRLLRRSDRAVMVGTMDATLHDEIWDGSALATHFAAVRKRRLARRKPARINIVGTIDARCNGEVVVDFAAFAARRKQGA